MKDNQKTGKVALYQPEDGGIQLEARLEEEYIWLSMAQIAELFHVNIPAISKHVKNVYAAKELVPSATVSKMETVRTEGKRRVVRQIDSYNLDLIISVGYRVNSKQATRFTDGNKRIASLLFILFLAENQYLYRPDGEAKINDNALVALALLIAESEPAHKDILIKLVMNLLLEEADSR